MDKAIIVGVYEFIGFHLCNFLLENGIEVTGIHIPNDENDLFLEEKRLSFGRNSNFSERKLSDIQSIQEDRGKTFCFIDYYSFYMKKEEEQLETSIHPLVQTESLPQMVFALPIQLCEETSSKKKQYLFELIEESWNFYLPTVYGPWQPLYFSFQKALLDPQSTVQVTEREYMKDALYIDDVIQSILIHVQEYRYKDILLKSKTSNEWINIMEMLLGKEKTNEIIPREIHCKQNLFSFQVDGIQITEGIEKQRDHLARLRLI